MTRISKHKIQLQQEIENRTSFMNTTKWKALFSMLKEINPSLISHVKLLLDDTVKQFTIPNINDFINERYLEKYWGIFELKEIEWILIPSEIISKRNNREEQLKPIIKYQNIEQIEQTLKRGKKFEYEVSEFGLKIYGYK